MATALRTAAAGFLLGAAATFVFFHVPRDKAPTSSSVFEHVPKMSRKAAESHRSSRYVDISNIEETLALPGDFAQTEALYALAGRSDSARVQDLIFQADRIADASDRSAALDILFLRLTELDPRSALALSRTAQFRGERQIEGIVWRSWGRLDLDQALAAAAALDSARERDLAAQSLYAAYDYGGNDATEYIEEALGIQPNTATRANYLFRLADRDPASAVNIINSMPDVSSRQQAAAQLGRRLGRLAGESAESYAPHFADFMARQSYSHSVKAAMAEADPEGFLDKMLADGQSLHRAPEAYRALQSLASRDTDKALAYLDRVRSPRHRQMLAGLVGQAIAESDPVHALAWAQENDPGFHNGVYIGMIGSVAASDPDLAVDAANRMPSARGREEALRMVAMTVAQRDPMKAIGLLDQIEQREVRTTVAESLASTWMMTDPDAALTWILGRDSNEQKTILSSAAGFLAQMDVENAIRWLPRLDEESQRIWRAQIAQNLAAHGSVAEAQRFIERFQDSGDYPQLRASAINGIARVDMQAAIEMASRVPEQNERDSIFAGIVQDLSHEDPQQAAALLTSINDAARRSQATGLVAMIWSHDDADGAEQWARDLARGDTRDDAIAVLAGSWDEMTPSRRLLVNSIGNAEKRKNALIGHIHQVARSDRQRAEEMVDDLDLNDEERQQLQDSINMIASYR